MAACKNASAHLFMSAKISHLALLPQGKAEAQARVRNMVEQMDTEGFGACTNYFECEAACPKEISVGFIAKMNREFLKASVAHKEKGFAGPSSLGASVTVGISAEFSER